jgi:hypothetical protein
MPAIMTENKLCRQGYGIFPVQSVKKGSDKSNVNGDGQIDPVAGEAGALTAYLQGQLMTTLSLAPGA